ncbi:MULTISPECIES: hypothetical protein [unclassified Candidatus Frackibacter]|uniref:hypothetical protein n=1 Tax=unclassified Candidatus Frackibacter TaxID=2648818 RepID=UPI00088D9EAD|nr:MULTISPECIES: hypothetical protein [unclassified Candidatus Frackibacter]SDC30618.1 hypothetical protein SAMN04515661_10662 [Candidatus Frackibacter sp. WG11]SEM74114.1 hypothetical protein SAMN04488698_11455 [Candidatus Frackibacter sp. WG12]SFL58462.1 hypothetical protein SAMN04488699_10661 [Candidatus Frackibacter sp. WG13]
MKKLIITMIFIALVFGAMDFLGALPEVGVKSQAGSINSAVIKNDFTKIAISVKEKVTDKVTDLMSDENSKENIARSDVGEIHLEGEIKKIYADPRAISIKLHMNDNHSKVENPIKIAPNAVFKIRKEEVTFRSLKIGDIVGIIINPKGKARSITVYNR